MSSLENTIGKPIKKQKQPQAEIPSDFKAALQINFPVSNIKWLSFCEFSRSHSLCLYLYPSTYEDVDITLYYVQYMH